MSPARHLHLAAYDIASHRRRAGALRLMRAYATGGQKSVHEIWLTAAEHRQVLGDMAHILDEGDRFLLLRLDPGSRCHTLGRGAEPENPEYFYIA